MRILHVISSRGFYGAENVVEQLCTALQQEGHAASIALLNCSPSPDHPLLARAANAGVPAFHLPCRSRIEFRTLRALRGILQENAIDVLHTHNYKSDVYGYLASRGLGIPLIATCHNWTDTTIPLRLYGVLDRMMLARFEHIVAVSSTVARRLRLARLSSASISQISNGVILPPLSARISGADSPIAGSPATGPLVIGAVTRLSPEKGVDILLHAAAEALSQGLRGRFVIAGDGPEREALLTLSRELGIAEQVTFLGFQPDIRSLLATFDMFVQPSRMDAMPMSVLEAMSAGLPVIASALGSIPELIEDGERGLLVPAGDSGAIARGLLRLAQDSESRRRLGTAAREYVALHKTASAMARHYLALYASALGEIPAFAPGVPV